MIIMTIKSKIGKKHRKKKKPNEKKTKNSATFEKKNKQTKI